VGLRDRALIAVMTYALARVAAVVAMRVEDYYPQSKLIIAGRRPFMRSRHAASASAIARLTSMVSGRWMLFYRSQTTRHSGQMPFQLLDIWMVADDSFRLSTVGRPAKHGVLCCRRLE
jgi:hypothetical protein